MRIGKLLALALVVVLAVTVNDAQADTVKADFVFIIDATGSMAGEIAGVKAGMAAFVAGLNAALVDARFAIVVFGGSAELVQDFSNGATTQVNLNKVQIGFVPGFQNDHNVNPEAGLEAIRQVLNAAPVGLVRNNEGGVGPLVFRGDARKNLILLTDEDSDRPYWAANRFAGQTSNEPPGFPNAAWQAEVDAAADAVIRNQAFVNMLVNRGDAPSRNQYGDWALDVSDPDFLNFDPAATLAALDLAGLGDSLEAQVLRAGLIGRAFDVGGANDADFVKNFFAAKIKEVVDNPPPPAPEPATLTLLCVGAIAVTSRRRRKKAA